MPIVTTDSQYTVIEAVFDAFHAQGRVSAEITTEDHSFECSATHHFEVDTDPASDAVAALGAQNDTSLFRAHSTYLLADEPVEYEFLFAYDAESGIVDVTGECVDITAHELYEQTPLQRPGFLHTGRAPADGPPTITAASGELLQKDIATQLLTKERASEVYTVDWTSSRLLSDTLLDADKDLFKSIAGTIEHVGGGRPIIPEVDEVTALAFCRHRGPAYSLGIWYPYRPINLERIWDIAEALDAQYVTACGSFPSLLEYPMPPAIWNEFPYPRTSRGELYLDPCIVQITWGRPERYQFF